MPAFVLRSRRLHIASIFLALLAAAFAVSTALPQRTGRGGARFVEMERRALADPFVGIRTGGRITSGLFPVRPTGVPTTPVVRAARSFLDALTEEQRMRVEFPVGDDEWRRWANQHSYPRQGVSLLELDEHQRKTALGLLQAGLSSRAFEQSRDIMRLNHSLAEITSNFDELGEWLYYMTVMGNPSEEQPWGWQIDGHHLIVNYFILGDQVVMTPTFMGSEPVTAEAGKHEGVSVMQEELQRGLALAQSLTPDQRDRAVISPAKDGNNALAEAFKDNLDLDYAGIRASELSETQRDLLMRVIEGFVGYMADGHAQVKMDEVREHLHQTHFAWVGEISDDAVFYYRVHSPVVLIEFDHQRPVFMRSLPRTPQRQHVHAVMRTPNGNDYGKDLLRQHYERSHRAELD